MPTGIFMYIQVVLDLREALYINYANSVNGRHSNIYPDLLLCSMVLLTSSDLTVLQ